MIEIKERCLQALETILASPDKVGPRFKSGFWPATNAEKAKDYAPDTTPVRVLPTAKQIAQADEFTSWVNALQDETERNDIWQWAHIRLKNNRTIRGYCKKMGLDEPKYSSRINQIFQKLEKISTIKPQMRQKSIIDDEREIRAKAVQSPKYWMQEDARPEHLPDSRDHLRLIRRMLRYERERNGPSPGR